jgi:tetratricopeptide (TPR) repeat protein
LTFRIAPFLFPLLLLPAIVSAADQSKLDATEAMFTVMAAANAAGYDAGLSSSPEIRTKVREAVLAANPPVLRELKAWYFDNPARDKTADLSRFISLGISVGDPPDFSWTKREIDIPPDVKDMDNFRAMLPRFYDQAHIEDLWQRCQPLVEETLARYQESIARTVLEANAYLRNPTYGFLGRRFSVLIDLLGAPNQVQTRSYGDDFFVVLTPSTDLHTFDIRHAYFRYLLDPLTIKYGMQLKEKESLLDIAEGAPLLREPYRSQFDLLASECLIKAIESRMMANPALVNAALREGYILTPFFDEQLRIYEKQEVSMKLFFPVMVQALSVRREIKRLEDVQFAKEAAVPEKPKATVAAAEPVLSVSAKTVAEADDYYKKRDLENALRLYRLALEQPGAPEDHSKAYFGMAHVALMQKDPEKADLLFHKTLESSPDADRRAWSYYYLGALADAAEEHEEAVKWYQQAVAVEGAPPAAVKSARSGIETPAQAVK